jgi:lipopolysaccharide/colanic/teichoic acid biosynthesis glycosyltransferase
LLFPSPLLLLVALLIMLDSSGPAFFRQERMGREFHPLRIYKFRTMVHDAPRRGGAITFGTDPQIIRVGWVFRKAEIDELPQLINVLQGKMSFAFH